MIIEYAKYVWESIGIQPDEVRPGDLIHIINNNPNDLTIAPLETYVIHLNGMSYRRKKDNILLYKEWIVYNRDSKINKVLTE